MSQNGSKMGRVHRVHCPKPAQQNARPRAQRPGRAPAAPLLRTAAPCRAAAHCLLPAPRALCSLVIPRACLPRARPARQLALRAQVPQRPAPRLLAPRAPCAPSQRPVSAQHPHTSKSQHTWAVAQFYFFCTKIFIFIFFSNCFQQWKNH